MDFTSLPYGDHHFRLAVGQLESLPKSRNARWPGAWNLSMRLFAGWCNLLLLSKRIRACLLENRIWGVTSCSMAHGFKWCMQHCCSSKHRICSPLLALLGLLAGPPRLPVQAHLLKACRWLVHRHEVDSLAPVHKGHMHQHQAARQAKYVYSAVMHTIECGRDHLAHPRTVTQALASSQLGHS